MLATRLAHTYSIVARDPKTLEMGVAVQSHYFSVGSIVPWAEPGVGVVATQALVELSYGPLGLELMRKGKTAPQALRELLVCDKDSAIRQVAMLDVRGRVAVHTGKKCIPEAGHLKGANYSVQANMMLGKGVWGSMARGFEMSRGDLAQRMLSSLEAAEKAGGDIRGKQSAAIVVVAGRHQGKPWEGRTVDLRVEDHPDPLGELARLLKLHLAYRHADRGDEAIERKEFRRAEAEYRDASKLAPGNKELTFWHAVSLVNAGQIGDAMPLFKRVFEEGDNWVELVPRLSKVGILLADEPLVRRIISVGKE